jgi:hypothetical protein
MNHEKGIDQLEFLLVFHEPEIPRFGEAVGEMLADSDNGRFVDAVDIKGDAVGFSVFKGRQDSLFSIHRFWLQFD